MDKLKFTLAISLLYFSTLSNAVATSCIDIINQARQAIPTSSNQQTASLWNLTWLQGRLGQADTSSVVETLYHWQTGDLLTHDTSVIKTANLPDAVANLDSAQAILDQMGPPQHIESTVLGQYRWVCAGSSSFLEVLMDKGKLVYADGQTCVGGAATCTSFSGTVTPSQLEAKINSVKPEVTVSAAQFKTYNDYFKTTINNEDALSADMVARLKSYLSNLRQCTPGLYQYAIPDDAAGISFMISNIQGLKDNNCLVQTDQHTEGKQTALPVLKCEYQQSSLNLFADSEAENLIKGIPNPQIDKVQATQCRVFLNGQEIPMGTGSPQ